MGRPNLYVRKAGNVSLLKCVQGVLGSLDF